MSTKPPRISMIESASDEDVPDEFRLAPFLSIPRANPYPTYQRLRKRGPVFICENGLALISGYDMAVAMLKDSRYGRFSAFQSYSAAGGQTEFGEAALFANPP